MLDVPIAFRQPERLYEGQTIKLDQLKQRLYQATQQIYHAKEKQTIALSHQLEQVARFIELKQLARNCLS